MALGGPGQQLSASIGSRTARDGSRDNNGSFGYRKDLQDHVLQSVSVTALTDTYGVGLASLASFRTDQVNGDGFLQRSSYNGNFTGGLNLDSTVVMGGQQLVMTSQHPGRGAGMIVDVESDIDDIACVPTISAQAARRCGRGAISSR
jgi:hypothetical protein